MRIQSYDTYVHTYLCALAWNLATGSFIGTSQLLNYGVGVTKNLLLQKSENRSQVESGHSDCKLKGHFGRENSSRLRIRSGSKDPNNRVLGPKYYNINGIWALKPYYLVPWTLRDTDVWGVVGCVFYGSGVLSGLWRAKGGSQAFKWFWLGCFEV